MLTNHKDINCQSRISKERREQLNQLALQAHKNSTPINTVDAIANLQLEAFALVEVFESLEYVGGMLDFYEHIDRAFKLLIEKDVDERASILETYQELSTLFRVIEKRSEYIVRKHRELNKVIDDLEVLEDERLNHKRGGLPC